MEKENLFYFILIFVVIITIFVFITRQGFYPFKKPSEPSTVETTIPGIETTTVSDSLIDDEAYVQNKMNSFWEKNPNADESYVRDVVYRDIARAEKNPEICELIQDDYLKRSCYNAVG